MNDVIYSMWVDPNKLAAQIRKLQETGAFVQSVKLISTKYDRVQYEIEYTDITNLN